MDDAEAEQQHVMGVLEPHFAPIISIFDDAMALYNSDVSPRARAEHDGRAAASAVYRHAWMGLQREFGEATGFHFGELRGLHYVNLRDLVVFRPKKVDANGRHVNSQTPQQKDFDRQRPLPGIPPAAIRVIIGYEPDVAFSKVERVIVRRPKGRWVSQIVTGGDVCSWIDITPVELPFTPGRRHTQ